MLKKLLIMSLAVFTLAAYNKKTEQTTYTVDKLMEIAETEVGKEVLLQGTVSHVCRHSGKKAFLADASGNLTMRITAPENAQFNQELKGKQITVKGILKEGERITREEILAQEEAVNQEIQTIAHTHKEDGSCCSSKEVEEEKEEKTEGSSCCSNHDKAEKSDEEKHHHQCQARLNNLKQMQDWMAANNKDYYALYYIETISYETAQ